MRMKVLFSLLALAILLSIFAVWRSRPKEVAAPNYLKEKLVPFEKPKGGNPVGTGTNSSSSQK